MADADPLFQLKAYFFLGNYQLAVTEGAAVKVPEAVKTEKEWFVQRALVAMGRYRMVIDETGRSEVPALKAINAFAVYLGGDKDTGLAQLETLSRSSTADSMVFVTAATAYLQDGNLTEALRCIGSINGIEKRALATQLYLKLQRVDLAEKEVQQMQVLDEDAILTQLALAWYNLAVGGPKRQEAFYIFQELADKFGMTALLANALAVSRMSQKKFEEAEKLLYEAVEKKSDDPETIANLVVCLQHNKRQPELINRQLRSLSPSHPILADITAMERKFDESAARFGPEVVS